MGGPRAPLGLPARPYLHSRVTGDPSSTHTCILVAGVVPPATQNVVACSRLDPMSYDPLAPSPHGPAALRACFSRASFPRPC